MWIMIFSEVLMPPTMASHVFPVFLEQEAIHVFLMVKRSTKKFHHLHIFSVMKQAAAISVKYCCVNIFIRDFLLIYASHLSNPFRSKRTNLSSASTVSQMPMF